MHIKIVLAIITLLTAVSLAGAEMYQWVDDNGVVTFKDSPPPASKKRSKVKVYNDSDFDPAPPPQPAPAKRKSKGSSTAAAQTSAPEKSASPARWRCMSPRGAATAKKQKSTMNSKGIPYVAYDIEKDSAAFQRYKEHGVRGVPLIIIGSNKMSGFSAEALEHYLEISK